MTPTDEYRPDEYRQVRRKLGLSNYAFARLLGVHLRTAQRYESGETPIPRPIQMMLRYIDVLADVAGSDVPIGIASGTRPCAVTTTIMSPRASCAKNSRTS
jgi:transcriptional regulator with XRE-family HTH domain